jgi:hypothetical protein
MNSSSFLSVEIVGVVLVITLVLLSGVRRALLAAGKSPIEMGRIVFPLGLTLFAWLVVALLLAWSGLFRSAIGQRVPYIALAIGIPIVTGILLIRLAKPVQEIITAVPQNWLVAFQFYRVAGVTFLILQAVGLLPGVFALPAGYGDLFVGLTAPLVGYAYRQNHPNRNRFVLWWNLFGIIDLVVALITGFLSSPSRIQLLSLDSPNTLIGAFPLVMVPIYAVPLSIVLHFVSLTKLSQERSAAQPVVPGTAF